MEFDFIVIGGGIGGIQIAALVSRLGRVLLLEEKEKIGGRAMVVEKNGFKLDFGPHPIRFGKKSSLAQTIQDIGGNIEFINPGLVYAYLSNGERHIFPSGLKGFLKTDMISIGQILQVFKLIRKNGIHDLAKLYPVSLKDFCDQNQVHPAIRQFLYMASATMQVNPYPERSSTGELFETILQVFKKKSAFYPKGGWGQIFAQLTVPILRNGEIRNNTKVTQILVENGKAVGVETTSGKFMGKIVISTIPVQKLSTILDEKVCPEGLLSKFNALRPTAGIGLDYCLSQKVTDETMMVFESPPGFGMVTSNMSPEVAPPQKSLITFFAPVDFVIMKDKIKREYLMKEFKETILKAYPKIASCIEFERELYFDMVDGVEIAVDQYRGIRPGIKDCQISNFYLTGDSVGGEGAGGDVGHNSVRECFELIKRELNHP